MGHPLQYDLITSAKIPLEVDVMLARNEKLGVSSPDDWHGQCVLRGMVHISTFAKRREIRA